MCELGSTLLPVDGSPSVREFALVQLLRLRFVSAVHRQSELSLAIAIASSQAVQISVAGGAERRP